jgi:hypothetical protein
MKIGLAWAVKSAVKGLWHAVDAHVSKSRASEWGVGGTIMKREARGRGDGDKRAILRMLKSGAKQRAVDGKWGDSPVLKSGETKMNWGGARGMSQKNGENANISV